MHRTCLGLVIVSLIRHTRTSVRNVNHCSKTGSLKTVGLSFSIFVRKINNYEGKHFYNIETRLTYHKDLLSVHYNFIYI